MHAYLITNDRGILAQAYDRIGDEAEKVARHLDTRIIAPIILATGPLSAGGKKTVRDILCRHSPEVKELLLTAKDHHFTIWVWSPRDNPDDAKLMALH
jgi:hypothetical protein